MLRKLILATSLLAAPGLATAWDGHGRVISVEPHFSISFGTRYHDGFRVLYESGGHHYWTHTHTHPGRYIALPPQGVYYGHPGHGHGHHKHHWKRHHDDWRDDHRDHGREWRRDHHRERHGRHHWD